jgi:transposase
MMRPADDLPTVYLCSTPVDFRKGMRSLAVWIETHLQSDPFAEGVFVFCNRPRTSLKILYWERNGFCLWQKRLEKERFFWPRRESQAIVELTVEQLNWLLEGYDINRMKPHQTLQYSSVL